MSQKSHPHEKKDNSCSRTGWGLGWGGVEWGGGGSGDTFPGLINSLCLIVSIFELLLPLSYQLSEFLHLCTPSRDVRSSAHTRKHNRTHIMYFDIQTIIN